MAFPQYANKNDRAILGALINQAIMNGWAVSVNDGEEWVLRRSNEVNDITAAMMSTDSDYLVFRDANGDKVGSVVTVYFNNGECIHDYSNNDNKQFNDLMERVALMIERFM